jgi:hypothetical protein
MPWGGKALAMTVLGPPRYTSIRAHAGRRAGFCRHFSCVDALG